MTVSAGISSLLQAHVPPSAQSYCYLLWNQTPFELKLTKSRHTKIGDFTTRRSRKYYRITLNHDLNPYLFLITYVHEVAHLRVFMHYEDKVDPHGEEWKRVFKNLMVPLLQESVFPPKILHLLRAHMANPKASSFADTALTNALREYDEGASSQVLVSSLPEGTVFRLQGKFFKKGKLRRTRILCREMNSRRQYLVPADALVSDVQLSLL